MQSTTPFKQIFRTALGMMSLLVAAPAWADPTYLLTPSHMTFSPSGSGATQSFQVVSTGDDPVAIELHMTGRQVGVDGTETQPDAESDFLVYPAQLLLQPGEAQTVRVTWLGEPNPDHELAYRIISEQLPIDLPQNSDDAPAATAMSLDIKVAFRYIASVYIRPPDAKSDVSLTSVTHQNTNGQDELVVNFKNQGTAHQLLNGLNLTIAPTGADGQPQSQGAVHLTPDQLEGVDGENILAGHERQFVIPYPAGLPIGPLTGSFEIQAE